MYKSTLKSLASVANHKHPCPRPNLANIRIDYGADTVTATATNGAVLLRVVEKTDGYDTSPDDDQPVFISGAAAAAAVKICTGSKDSPARIRIDGADLLCDNTHRIAGGYDDSPFPNTDQVWPDEPEISAEITFNAVLLKRLADAAIVAGRNSGILPSVTLQITDEQSALGTPGPVLFSLNNSDDDTIVIDGLIMPMRR